MSMLAKFETKSNRVKGLSFHPKRPWILSSLHTGEIQLHDYRLEILIESFKEHEGPVRGVAFHPTQDMFCSGGDDYKLKVWSTRTRKCLFTLTGHLDYIRTVSFHHDLPWIISASDDQTIRIWNWQSRNCISVLTVMSAFFHPKNDLIVSGSLDQSIRVWDYSSLRKKHTTAKLPSQDTSAYGSRSNNQSDVFGGSDAVVKFVLEGHDRGVDWATFHPTLPLILSASDDRSLKVWRMNETKAWEVDNCRGHLNNVSSAMFATRLDLIISNSEDKTLRVWDINTRKAIHIYKKEERFWALAGHPTLNLFAAGHDNGFLVFKLERERPALTVFEDTVFYIKQGAIRAHHFDAKTDVPVCMLQKQKVLERKMNSAPKNMHYNPAERALLVFNPISDGGYELYMLGEGVGDGTCLSGAGHACIFIARNRFAVLDKINASITIRDLRNESVKVFKVPNGSCDMLYSGLRSVLVVTKDSVMLYDTETGECVGERAVQGVKYAIWTSDLQTVALLSKHGVLIVTREMVKKACVTESAKVKSGRWDGDVFVYSTINHAKYLLMQGDHGTIKTLESPVYILRVMNGTLHALDRSGNVVVHTFDPTEYLFKLALAMNQYEKVISLMQSSPLVGQSLLAHLYLNNHPHLALSLTKDPQTRFDLAILAHSIPVALAAARTLNNDSTWQALEAEAMMQGDFSTVEIAMQKAHEYAKLSVWYAIKGDAEKMVKMGKVAEVRGDVGGRYTKKVIGLIKRYTIAMMRGDATEQIATLMASGQVQLAYMTAKTHGMDTTAAEILAGAGVKHEPKMPKGSQRYKNTMCPVRKVGERWPMRHVEKKIEAVVVHTVNVVEEKKEDGNAWGDDNMFEDTLLSPDHIQLDDEAGWGLHSPTILSPISASHDHHTFIMPTRSLPPLSHTITDLVSQGEFELAMQSLNRQFGIVKFDVMKETFMRVYAGSAVTLATLHPAPPLMIPVTRETNATGEVLAHPHITLSYIETRMGEAYAFTTAGRFAESVAVFSDVILHLPFIVTKNTEETAAVRDALATCREYINGLRMEIARRALSVETDLDRILQLATSFTRCEMRPEHKILSLRSAMRIMYTAKNFGDAAQFAKQVLGLQPDAQLAEQARGILVRCERTPTNAVEVHEGDICAGSFEAIENGLMNGFLWSNDVGGGEACGYCGSRYTAGCKGDVCVTCGAGEVGRSAPGF